MDTEERKKAFLNLYEASAESEVEEIIARLGNNNDLSWHPLGGIENNYGVIENQQSSPVAALIEKITNSIDAILMRRCFESGIDPRSEIAPKTMDQAIERFFPREYKNWHLRQIRRAQSESIQIIASGSKRKPCLVIYDAGEGQHPDKFESTFLSLLRGNKNEIPFVQGKYNMGGTGAIVFCGKHRFQLIGSRRFDNEGDFGFTLIRKHPFSAEEAKVKKDTWYEYIKITNQIPSFPITDLDLGLWKRKFINGTVIKLYDYELPTEARGGAITHDFRGSINEFLFEPALPILLVDSKERYPNDKVLDVDAFGLKRMMESEGNKYVEKHFSEEVDDHAIGKLKITCYVFHGKVEGKSVKETRDVIQDEYFRNGMAVLFSLNGQVHGHLTSEFITRSLKMPLLKNHLLVHVDCTQLKYDFRHELFMASRDRLKSGDDTAELRKRLAEILLSSDLADVYKERRNAISTEGGDASDLLRAFSKNLPFNQDLVKLLSQAFKIGKPEEHNVKNDLPPNPKPRKEKEPFCPKRYPSYFRLKTSKDDKFITLPEGEEKTVLFATDVEDDYFDRADDPGDLKVSVLKFRRNETSGGKGPATIDDPTTLIDIRKASPKEGTIRIGFAATNELNVGDELEISAVLGGPEDIESRLWVKIVEAKGKTKEVDKPGEKEMPALGLPKMELVYKEKPEGRLDIKTWEELAVGNIHMDWLIVMHPFVEDNQLAAIYINMDSTVLRNYIGRQGNISVEQKELAEKRYISSIYFHTIFLYTITKNKNYEIKQAEQAIEIEEYLKEVFSTHYCDFLLNFGTEELIQSLSE